MSSKISKKKNKKQKYELEDVYSDLTRRAKNSLKTVVALICFIIFAALTVNQFVNKDKQGNTSETVNETVSIPTESVTIPDVSTPDTEDTAAGDVLDLTYLEYDGTNAFIYTENKLTKADTENVTEGYTYDKSTNITGSATKIVSKEDIVKGSEERGDISDIKPSGWHNAKYDGISNGGWVYNRCHLIAHCLGGDDIKENLVTGTRYLNIDGMWQIEETVKYAAEDGHIILYKVTPCYRDSELVCRGILMQAFSIDDNGATVNLSVYCFNVQPNVTIDYATGYTHE